MNFKDKVVIITGSSSGLGRATAIKFVKEGAKVVINGLNEKRLGEVEKEIKDLEGEVLVIKANVGEEKEVIDLIDKTIMSFGKIDVLVNNAAVVFDRPFNEQTSAEWDKTYKTDLKSVFMCSKYAAEYLKKQSGASIINVSSTNGINTLYTWSMDYDAMKAAIINLTTNLAQELAPDIRVNAIAPGWITTTMNEELSESIIKEESKKIALGRFANPEEVADVILFLASNKARYITGTTIKVDGGML